MGNSDDITSLKGVGEKTAALLSHLDIHTVEDMNPFVSVWLTIRNMIGGFMKKVRYSERICLNGGD